MDKKNLSDSTFPVELDDKQLDEIVSIIEEKAQKKAAKGGYLKPDDLSESGNALLFSRLYESQLRWSKALGWMVWDGKRWFQDDAAAKRLVMSFTGKQIEDAKKYSASAMLESSDGSISASGKEYLKFSNRMRSNSSTKAILELAAAHLAISATEFDSDPFMLNTPDGVINLRDGSIRPHDPYLFCSKITGSGLTAVSDKQRALWQEFLNTITTDAEGLQLSFKQPEANTDIQIYLQKSTGSAIIGRVFFEGIQIAIGAGRNGKSTFYNAVSKALGEYAGSLDINTMTTDRFNKGPAKAMLRGKRLITCSELEEGQRLSIQTLKQLASTDPLTIEAKYKDPETIEPSHHIVMLSNYLPRIGSTDDGTWRRINIIPFKNRIPENSTKSNYAQTLFEEAGSAILEWAIEGARMFIEDGLRLIAPKDIVKATKEYRAQEDWLKDFLEVKCTIDPTHSIRVGVLYEAYRKYSEGIKTYTRSMQDFNRALEQRGFTKVSARSHTKIWKGISLQDESPDAEFQFLNRNEWERSGVPIS